MNDDLQRPLLSKACSSFLFCLLLTGLCFPLHLVAQDYNFVHRDTTINTIPFNVDNPGSATILLYSPFLPHLNIESTSVQLGSSRYDAQRDVYQISMPPDVRTTLVITYPGFNRYSLPVPAVEANGHKAFVIAPPDSYEGGTLIIQPTPSNARVEVDRIFVGEGRVELMLPYDTYDVRMTSDGYVTRTESVAVAPDAPDQVTYRLDRSKQTLNVTSNVSGANVYIEGALQTNKTPMSIEVDQGLLQVRVELAGYIPYTQEIEIGSGSNVVNAQLRPQITIQEGSAFVRNESLAIQDGILTISYNLVSTKKRYKVGVDFIDANNQTMDVPGELGGHIGGGQSPGTKSITWPIPQNFSMEGVRVRVNAKSQINPLVLGGGGILVAGAVAVCIVEICNSDDPTTLAESPPGRP